MLAKTGLLTLVFRPERTMKSENYSPRTDEYIPYSIIAPHRLDIRRHRQSQEVLYSSEISAKDKSAISRAVLTANSSTHHKYRVGAVISVSGRLTSASNRYRNSAHEAPFTELSVHAEVRAVLRACSNGKGGTIYVARLGGKGRLLPSHPCLRCMAVLLEAGIKRIVWFDGVYWRGKRLQRG